jgi:hypothetical protein
MIAAGTACTVNVTFVPQAAGTRAATLNITDNALNSPQTMALTGAAVDYSVGVTPGSPQSVVVTAGQTATYNLQASPIGGFTGAVTLACTGVPASATCSISQPSVNIAGTSSVGFTVSVATTAASASWVGPLFRGTPSGNSQDFGRKILLFPLLALGLPAILVMIAGASCARRPSRIHALAAIPALCVAVLLILAGCGGGSGGGAQTTSSTVGTPSGIYTLTVSGSVQSVTRTVQLTLDVQ